MCQQKNERPDGDEREQDSAGGEPGTADGLTRGWRYSGRNGDRRRKRSCLGRPCVLIRQELRNVAAGGNFDAHRMLCTLGCVVAIEALSKPMGFDADNGVGALVEVCFAAQGVNGDVVFLDLLVFALERTAADVAQEVTEAGRALKYL